MAYSPNHMFQRPPQARREREIDRAFEEMLGLRPRRLTLADLARRSGVDLDTLPFRHRYHPVRRAIWAALMLDAATLSNFVSKAIMPADDSLAGHLEALDVVAARLVLKAVGGDLGAITAIMNRIEGRVRRRGDPVRDASPTSVGATQTIEGIVAALAERPRTS